MDIQLSKLIGHKVIVLGPSFFHTEKPGDQEKLESVTLLAVEAAGIWIESQQTLDRVVDRFRVKPAAAGLAFFLPFSQITTVLAGFDPSV